MRGREMERENKGEGITKKTERNINTRIWNLGSEGKS